LAMRLFEFTKESTIPDWGDCAFLILRCGN
jgi:hypothetical protein